MRHDGLGPPPEPQLRREEASVEALFAAHAPSVRRFARHLLHDDALADDVVQEVFARLHVAPLAYDPLRGPALAYLLASCRGRALDMVRSETARARRQGLAAVRADNATTHVEEDVINRDLQERLTEAIDRLPDHERQPLLLAYFGGFTYEEVADLLGDAPGTVKSRIRRGLLHLKAILRAERLDDDAESA